MESLSIHVDLDGTLIDTSTALILSYRDAILEFGGKFTEETENKILEGAQYESFIVDCFSMNNTVDKNELHQLKVERYKNYYKNTKLNLDLVDKLVGFSCNKSLVTNANRKNTEELLRHHKVHHLFKNLTTNDDVKNPKPHPEPYLRSIALSPAESHIAIEDSLVGISSAEAAGCITFNVNDLTNFRG
jgi:beta-phosphoglucomutase-like phosphatase (HAD superfamily)